MDEDEEMEQLRAQEAKRVRDEAKKCLRHASFQLGKAAYEIDEYLKDFSTARIPIRRQVILNEMKLKNVCSMPAFNLEKRITVISLSSRILSATCH
jgi:hypothetical protein